MAAGFAMLEVGLVRTKNTTKILTKNIALYAIACIIYLLCGYQIMYGGSYSGLIPGLGFLLGDDNAVAAVYVNTNAAAAGGVVTALIFSRAFFGKADLTLTLNGAIAGLVAITAEPLIPAPPLAAIVGGIGGVIVVPSILLLEKLRVDDPVGAISAHGMVGFWGLVAVPLSNADASFAVQLAGAGVILFWVFLSSLIICGVLKATIGIRASEEGEINGLDLAECGQHAYPEFLSADRPLASGRSGGGNGSRKKTATLPRSGLADAKP